MASQRPSGDQDRIEMGQPPAPACAPDARSGIPATVNVCRPYGLDSWIALQSARTLVTGVAR